MRPAQNERCERERREKCAAAVSELQKRNKLSGGPKARTKVEAGGSRLEPSDCVLDNYWMSDPPR